MENNKSVATTSCTPVTKRTYLKDDSGWSVCTYEEAFSYVPCLYAPETTNGQLMIWCSRERLDLVRLEDEEEQTLASVDLSGDLTFDAFRNHLATLRAGHATFVPNTLAWIAYAAL